VRIPANSTGRAEVLARLEEYRAADAPWREGRTFGHAFLADGDGKAVAEAAHGMYLWENAMDPLLFPSVLRLEREVVAMAAAHLGGDADTVGSFTSGGTESVMLAVKAARDLARERGKPGPPELALPQTAHPCFHKAAAYLGLETVVIPVDAGTFRADPEATQAALNDRTALLVASAPSYAHGVVDPVAEIGRIALDADVPLHVDACMGGFMLPYFRQLGTDVPAFDLGVPGVTSMSMDFHKYAFAPKGASVVLYKRPEHRRRQIFTWSGWPGYALVNPTVQSTRSGGAVAGTWAVLRHYGDAGYLRIARALRDATARIVDGVRKVPGLRVLAEPEMTLVAVASEDASVFRICEAMGARGWHMYPQFRMGALPESFHLTVLPWNVAQVDAWLADLGASVDALRTEPPAETLGPLRTMLGGLDPQTVTDADIEGMLDAVGLGGGGPPEGMGEINEVLNTLAAPFRDRILTIYYDAISRPMHEEDR